MPVEELDQAFARAHYVLARHYDLQAMEALRNDDRELGHELGLRQTGSSSNGCKGGAVLK
ncbi:MAG: hypothetical protein P8189_32345 [Anaerolineae bacterium]